VLRNSRRQRMRLGWAVTAVRDVRGGNAIAGGSLAKYVRSTANDYGAAASADGWGRSIEPLWPGCDCCCRRFREDIILCMRTPFTFSYRHSRIISSSHSKLAYTTCCSRLPGNQGFWIVYLFIVIMSMTPRTIYIQYTYTPILCK